MYGYIYKITNLINGKIYIGKAKNIKSRFDGHIRDSFNKGCVGYENLLHRAIRKYGKNTFIIEQIDTAESLNDLNTKEKYYIKSLNTQNNKIGYNIAGGGDGGDVLSTKSAEDYMIAIKSYKQAALKRESNIDLKNKKSDTMKRLRATTNPIWNKGIPMSEKAKEKYKTTIQKKKANGYIYPKHRVPSIARKPVKCIELNKVFDYARAAKDELNLNIGEKAIRTCCNGKVKTAGGYHWTWQKI